MQEHHLIKFSILCILVGVLALFAVVQFGSLDDYYLSLSSPKDVGSVVKLTGKVEKVSVHENVTFLEISRQEHITIVAFENVSVQPKDIIDIVGTIQDHQGKREVLADSIKIS